MKLINNLPKLGLLQKSLTLKLQPRRLRANAGEKKKKKRLFFWFYIFVLKQGLYSSNFLSQKVRKEIQQRKLHKKLNTLTLQKLKNLNLSQLLFDIDILRQFILP